MAAGGQGRSSSNSKRSADRTLTGAGDRPQRRGFSQPGRTKIDRNRDLPVERQIRSLLKNPTPSPAEQNRLCELTRTKSYRAAVGVAKRMLVPARQDDVAIVDDSPTVRRRDTR